MQTKHKAFITKTEGACLPHWTKEAGVYSVTFRLEDSLPATAREAILRYRQEFEATKAKIEAPTKGLRMSEEIVLHRLYSARIDALLDAGAGSCLMRDDRAARIVSNALHFFEGTRYRLVAWAVMPNHVHVVFAPISGHSLDAILQSWKGFTTHKINGLFGRSGRLWQKESYDHLVRGQEDLDHHVGYVLNNPVAAGLKDWPWVGRLNASTFDILTTEARASI
ncbi:MAG: transposase [Phycisphaerales bacterium]